LLLDTGVRIDAALIPTIAIILRGSSANRDCPALPANI
jgi:hypothetical protein